MDKATLRTQLLAVLADMSSSKREARSIEICDELIASVDWSIITSVHCYQALEHLIEVDPTSLIDYIQAAHPQISLELAPSFANPPLPIGQYDLIIVPVLGYDDEHNRLGRGAGWYDRFLAAQPHARTIGLAFWEQRVAAIPTEPHDQPLDKILVR